MCSARPWMLKHDVAWKNSLQQCIFLHLPSKVVLHNPQLILIIFWFAPPGSLFTPIGPLFSPKGSLFPLYRHGVSWSLHNLWTNLWHKLQLTLPSGGKSNLHRWQIILCWLLVISSNQGFSPEEKKLLNSIVYLKTLALARIRSYNYIAFIVFLYLCHYWICTSVYGFC